VQVLGVPPALPFPLIIALGPAAVCVVVLASVVLKHHVLYQTSDAVGDVGSVDDYVVVIGNISRVVMRVFMSEGVGERGE
jgi:hypothetical protein